MNSVQGWKGDYTPAPMCGAKRIGAQSREGVHTFAESGAGSVHCARTDREARRCDQLGVLVVESRRMQRCVLDLNLR
jgi:hypothetical protein